MAYITKEDLKKFLNIKATDIQYDDVLDDVIAGSIDDVENRLQRDFSGSIQTGVRTTPNTISRNGKTLLWADYDLISVSSIRVGMFEDVATADALDASTYRIYDAKDGLIEIDNPAMAGRFYRTEYTYGNPGETPAAINQAITLNAALTMTHSNFLDLKQLNSVQLGALNQSLANSSLTSFRKPEEHITKLLSPYRHLTPL